MSDLPAREITLPVIFAALMDFRADVVERLEAQRAELAEGQSVLFQQAELHRRRLDEHAAELAELKAGTQDHDDQILQLRKRYHDLNNRLQPLFIAYEDFGKRLEALETRRDTQPVPPPTEDPSGG